MHCLAYYDKIAPYSTQIFRINTDNSGIIIHYDAWKNQIQVFDFKSNKGVSYTLYAKTVYSFDLIYEGNNSYKFYINGKYIISASVSQCKVVSFVSAMHSEGANWNNCGIWNDLFFITGNDINSGMIKNWNNGFSYPEYIPEYKFLAYNDDAVYGIRKE